MTFTDAPSMTAVDKERVLKAWQRFLMHGLKQNHFSKRLYTHLHLHCGFIAHYNIDGFYAEYFQAGEDKERFFADFRSSVNLDLTLRCGDYDDLHAAMLEVLDRYQAAISRQTEEDINRRIELLDAAVQRAKKDPNIARRLLTRIKF